MRHGQLVVSMCECCMRARKKKPLQNWPTLIATLATLVVTIEING